MNGLVWGGKCWDGGYCPEGGGGMSGYRKSIFVY